jgi:branched-chain amino acid aminotransferase
MRIVYLNGKFRPARDANLSVMSNCVSYGTAAFEGMKAFYRPREKNWYLFRPEEYYRRLCRSTAMIDIDFKTTEAEFINLLSKLLKKNNIKNDVYLRPVVYRDALGIGLMKPSGYGFSVFVEKRPRSRPRKATCCLVSRRRPTDGSYGVKLAGNYLLSYFAQREAARKKRRVGILLSADGYVSEGSLMNIFFADNGTVLTPSLACGPLAGITRKSVIEIIRRLLGLTVREGKYRYRRLLNCEEIFLTGTGSGINHVRRLDDRTLPINIRRSIAVKVWDVFDSIISGKTEDFQHWLRPVE